MANQVEDIMLDEISLVGKGAAGDSTIRPRVALFKMDDVAKAASFKNILDGMEAEEEAQKIQMRLFELSDVLQRSISGIIHDPEETNKAAAINQTVKEFEEVMRAGLQKMARAEGGEDMSDDVKKLEGQIIELTKRAEDLTAELEKANTALKSAEETIQTLEKAGDSTEEDEAKLPEAVQKQLDERDDQIQKLMDEREHDRIMKDAEKLDRMPVTADELVKIIKTVPEGEDRDALVAMLKAAQEGIRVTEQTGSDGDGDAGTATAKIQKMAEDLVSKGEAKNIHSARVTVRKANPDLRDQEAAERAH